MKVKDLIEQLKNFDPDKTVIVYSECYTPKFDYCDDRSAKSLSLSLLQAEEFKDCVEIIGNDIEFYEVPHDGN